MCNSPVEKRKKKEQRRHENGGGDVEETSVYSDEGMMNEWSL